MLPAKSNKPPRYFSCVAVGTNNGYSLYSINSTDSMDLVHNDGES